MYCTPAHIVLANNLCSCHIIQNNDAYNTLQHQQVTEKLSYQLCSHFWYEQSATSVTRTEKKKLQILDSERLQLHLNRGFDKQ